MSAVQLGYLTKLVGNNICTVSTPRFTATMKRIRRAIFEGIRPKSTHGMLSCTPKIIELISETARELVGRAMALKNSKLAHLGAGVARTGDPATIRPGEMR